VTDDESQEENHFHMAGTMITEIVAQDAEEAVFLWLLRSRQGLFLGGAEAFVVF
jgi:hypothetical protein